MISNISTGRYLTASFISQQSIDMTQPSAGMVRMNGSYLEAFTGYSWVPVSQSTSICLTAEAEWLLDWAREKKLEEEKLAELCKTNPTLRKARENYEIIKKLTINDLTYD